MFCVVFKPVCAYILDYIGRVRSDKDRFRRGGEAEVEIMPTARWNKLPLYGTRNLGSDDGKADRQSNDPEKKVPTPRCSKSRVCNRFLATQAQKAIQRNISSNEQWRVPSRVLFKEYMRFLSGCRDVEKWDRGPPMHVLCTILCTIGPASS